MPVRRAEPRDAATLSSFGKRLFLATFAPDTNPDDLTAYLDTAYTEERQRAEIADPSIDTLLLEREGALAAFAQVKAGTAPGCVDGPTPIELWRFYVDTSWQGRGAAAELLAEVEDAARARGGRTMWLGVWERNVRAQSFYRKHGFTVVGSQVFVVGSDPQRDLVMAKVMGS